MSDQAQPPLRLERDGAIARIVLDRPAAGNTLNLPMAQALVEAASTSALDPSVRCVVLTGTGRFFCAGGDVAAFGAASDPAPLFDELAATLHRAVSTLARMDKPLVAAVNGPAAGAGVSLTALADIVIASRAAHFTLAYGAIGLTPDGGATWLLPRLIGLRRTQELILTNRRIGADEAAAIGLVTEAVDVEAFEAKVAAVATRLVESATGAVAATRALLLESFASGLEAQLAKEARAITRASQGAEGLEGVQAFLAKRAPVFIPSAKPDAQESQVP